MEEPNRARQRSDRPEGSEPPLLRRRVDVLPPHLQADLLHAGWTSEVLGCLVVETVDAERIIDAMLPGVDGPTRSSLSRTLLDQARQAATLGKRKVERMAQEAAQPSLVTGTGMVNMGDAYDYILSGSVELARKIHKSRVQRLKRQEPTEPEKIELEETRRWATEIAGYIAVTSMPAKEIVEATGDPVATWIRLCGNRRARTLRQSARSWHRFFEWLQLSHGLTWPSNVSQVIDYLEERVLEPCGPTIPSSLLMSLQLLESVGGQDPQARMGSSPLLANVVKNMEKDLSTGRPPRKTAPVYTVATVVAAELLVLDRNQGDVARLCAYVLLLMIWGALRTDDVQWLDKSRTCLTEVGWRSVLVRSKTSGAGRRVRELPVFVSRLVCLSGGDWLQEGHDLWSEVAEHFPGNLFLCRPRQDGSEFTKKYLDATGLAAWLKWTLLQLPSLKRVPRGWKADYAEGLMSEEWAVRWSGHSARHCLPSWGAAVGIPPEQRAFLGRWRAGVEVDTNAYVLTSRQVVHAAQETVARSFCTGNPPFSEMEIFEEMKQFGMERRLEVRAAIGPHVVWKRRGNTTAMFLDFPTVDIEKIPGALGEDGEVPLIPHEDEPGEAAPFWVSISRRTGFRRLHRHQGCGVDPNTVYKAVEVFKLNSEVADKKCQICFKTEVSEKPREEEDTSSGSSSSSDTDDEQ